MSRLFKVIFTTLALSILVYLVYDFYVNNKSKVTVGAREVTPTDISKGTIFISYNGSGDKCSKTKPCGVTKGLKKASAGDCFFQRWYL